MRADWLNGCMGWITESLEEKRALVTLYDSLSDVRIGFDPMAPNPISIAGDVYDKESVVSVE